MRNIFLAAVLTAGLSFIYLAAQASVLDNTEAHLARQPMLAFDGASANSVPVKDGVALIDHSHRLVDSRMACGSRCKKIDTYEEVHRYRIVDHQTYEKAKETDGGAIAGVVLGVLHLIPGIVVGVLSGDWMAGLALGVLMGAAGVVVGIVLGIIIAGYEARHHPEEFEEVRRYEKVQEA